jgi:heat shock protein HtpX
MVKAIDNKYVLWCLFAIYVTLLFTLPFVILGSYLGLSLGLGLSACFLFTLFFRAEEKTSQKLNLVPLSLAEAPEIYHTVKNYSRRLGIPPPRIERLQTEALNIGVFGLSRRRSVLILTDGLLTTMTRAQISSLIGRELTAIWHGDTCLSTWFSRFLSLMEGLGVSQQPLKALNRKHSYSLRWVVVQTILLPLALLPQFLLLRIRRVNNLDLKSLKLTQLPQELAESFRLMEAMSSRLTFRITLSTTPFFLLPPAPTDPLSKLLFSETYNQKSFSNLTQSRLLK